MRARSRSQNNVELGPRYGDAKVARAKREPVMFRLRRAQPKVGVLAVCCLHMHGMRGRPSFSWSTHQVLQMCFRRIIMIRKVKSIPFFSRALS